MAREKFDAVYVGSPHLGEALELGKLLQNERILEQMPDGVVLLDGDNTIIWGNGRLREWTGRESIVGLNFYAVLGSPEILGPDFCPFHTALATGARSCSTLRSNDNHYFRVHAIPVNDADGPPQNLIVTIRDVTSEVLQQQKLAAIHQAGVELADLSPDELAYVDRRAHRALEIEHSAFHPGLAELRRRRDSPARCEHREAGTALAAGMVPEAMDRALYAQLQNNGVTGFVAATGKSYLCEDTTEDPLYLEGCKGAKSSLTVPLILHDEVIGTFNVESPEPRAFTESDLQFLEIFTRDVAVALNTLELLVAEKATTAAENIEAMHRAVALPVDDILNDAVNLMERYIGHDPDVGERLQSILRNARDIKQVIQQVGQKMAPSRRIRSRCRISSGRNCVACRFWSWTRTRMSAAPPTTCSSVMAVWWKPPTTPVKPFAWCVIWLPARLRLHHRRHSLARHDRLRVDAQAAGHLGHGADGAHDGLRLRPGPLDRQSPPGRAADRRRLYKPFRLDALLDTVEKVSNSSRMVGQG